MKLPEIKYPETPSGKRVLYTNKDENIVGYVSGKRFWEFGSARNSANHSNALGWLKTGSLKEAHAGYWLEEAPGT